MARQRRQTLPLDTVHGTLTDYATIERHLVDGEMKGRAWLFAQSSLRSLASGFTFNPQLACAVMVTTDAEVAFAPRLALNVG